jgi:hypothetical protein
VLMLVFPKKQVTGELTGAVFEASYTDVSSVKLLDSVSASDRVCVFST